MWYNARVIAIAMCAFLPLSAGAQKILGLVVQKNTSGVLEPVYGANVFWLGTTHGTTTRENGIFLIDRIDSLNRLVISFVGAKPDTITITDQNNLKIELQPLQELQEVTVSGWKPTTQSDFAATINMAVMSEKELFKAACCNLSESFETNPSVDVAFTDAVTGTRQIQLLGLAGPNTLISLEFMPGIRGLASSQGLTLIPGTWIQSIQVTKGAGSVVNGYESIAGQINVELQKPQQSDKLVLNGYISSAARSETNVVCTAQLGKQWGTTFLIHGSTRPLEMDQNGDSFLDFPKGNQVNFINRWAFRSGTQWLGQFSIKYLKDEKTGGQTGYEPGKDKFTTNRYGLEINTERSEFVGKLGHQFKGLPYKSVGLQVSVLDHRQDSYFGFNLYGAREKSVYANGIYQSIIGTTAHKFKTGLSFQYQNVEEKLSGIALGGGNRAFNRTEVVPGAFFEYSYDHAETFSLIAGMRVDQHNLFGILFTPRLHVRLTATPTTVIRASAGKGYRVASIIAENPGFLASSRLLQLTPQIDKAYGFRPDQAWNYGVSVSQEFALQEHTGIFSMDYYYTQFRNQAVVDYDISPQEIHFHSLDGQSYAHSAQAQIDYQIRRRFDVRLAYRWQDVQTDYRTGRLRKPMVPRSRAFLNLAYGTRNHWKVDYTIHNTGEQRIPATSSNPSEYQLPAVSNSFITMNAQVSKDLGARWNLYAGGENLTNYKLSSPIVAADDPFGPYFDTSMVWGPVFGRMWYVGFRYKVK